MKLSKTFKEKMTVIQMYYPKVSYFLKTQIVNLETLNVNFRLATYKNESKAKCLTNFLFPLNRHCPGKMLEIFDSLTFWNFEK